MEIILASVLAMVVAYFIIDLTIKLKNKNDDLLVKTLVATDQAIIYNTIMRDLYDDSVNFKCSDISVNGNTFKYKDFSNIVSEYASVGNFTCEEKSGDVNISLPISVKQLTDEKFDITIETKDTYVASETPSGGDASCPYGYTYGTYAYGGITKISCYRSVSETEGCKSNETLQGCESSGNDQCWCTLNQ